MTATTGTSTNGPSSTRMAMSFSRHAFGCSSPQIRGLATAPDNDEERGIIVGEEDVKEQLEEMMRMSEVSV